MNCEDCNQRLLDYAYEELDAPDRAAVEEALARCPQCREELAAIRTTMAAYSQLDALDVPAKLHADIVRSARLAAADARPERSWLGSVLASPVFGVALSVSLLAGGVWMFERLTSRSPALDGAGAEQAAVAAGERPSPEAEVPGAQPERPTAPAAAPVEAPIDEGGAFDQRAAPSEETPLNRDLAEGVVPQPSLDAAAPAAAARTTTREEPGNLRGGSMVTLGGTLGGGRTANEDTAAGRTGSSTGYGAVGGSAGYGAAAGAAPAGAMEAEMPDVVAPAPAPPAREAAAPAQPARIAEADSATERADSDELFAMADDAVRQQEQQASTRERRPRRGGADAPAAAEPMAPAARESEEVVELSSATTRSSASAGAAAPAATAAPAPTAAAPASAAPPPPAAAPSVATGAAAPGAEAAPVSEPTTAARLHLANASAARGRGDNAAAARELDAALAAGGLSSAERATALYDAGVAYAASGARERAVDRLTRFLTEFPSDARVPDARARIDALGP